MLYYFTDLLEADALLVCFIIELFTVIYIVFTVFGSNL